MPGMKEEEMEAVSANFVRYQHHRFLLDDYFRAGLQERPKQAVQGNDWIFRFRSSELAVCFPCLLHHRLCKQKALQKTVILALTNTQFGRRSLLLFTFPQMVSSHLFVPSLQMKSFQ